MVKSTAAVPYPVNWAMSCAEREAVAHSSPEYDSTRVAAYASSRMPACYAVLYRVFDELHLHLPHFSPKTMLDFGSGPGTAVWAAREVSISSTNSRVCCPTRAIGSYVKLLGLGVQT